MCHTKLSANVSGGPRRKNLYPPTPLACCMTSSVLPSVCPAACCFRGGYLNTGPKSRLICHSAAWENWATPQRGYLIISFVPFCSGLPRGDTNILFGEGAGEKRSGGKERGEKFGGDVGATEGSYAANAVSRVCAPSVMIAVFFFSSSLSHFLTVQEMQIADRKSSESHQACRNLRAAVGRLKMGAIRSLRNCCDKLISAEEDKHHAKTYIE